MMQKPWFKLFIWFVTTFFFFLASGVVISIFRPGPSESEVMQFMMGMMSAMDKSMMGVTMNMESDSALRSVVTLANTMTLPVIVISIIVGFVIRIRQRGDDKNV